MVEERIADSPIYPVKPTFGRGKRRALHRNLFLPFHALLFDMSDRKASVKRHAKCRDHISACRESVRSEDWARSRMRNELFVGSKFRQLQAAV